MDEVFFTREEFEIIKGNGIDVKLNNILDKMRNVCIMGLMSKSINGDELRGSLKVIKDLENIFVKKRSNDEA